jgi:hypothetical protein
MATVYWGYRNKLWRTADKWWLPSLEVGSEDWQLFTAKNCTRCPAALLCLITIRHTHTSTLKFTSFLGAFAKLRKATTSFVSSSRPSVCPHGATRLIFMKFDIWGSFENLSRKFKFHFNRTRMKGTLHEDQYTFLILSRSILLRMKNVSEKRCRETCETHFMFSNFFFFFDNRAVYEIMWKIL